MLHDLAVVESALSAWPGPVQAAPTDDYAFGLASPWERIRRGPEPPAPQPEPDTAKSPARVAATESIASRAGALSDEVDFPSFVAGLLHGTFDAVVDATIRQIEEFAGLVSAVAKDVDSFTRDNVTVNQVRDDLAEKHPGDLVLDVPTVGEPQLRVRPRADDDESEAVTPGWLADYGMAGTELTDEVVEQELVPAARRVVGEGRLQLLATMVLLGMNRVVVRDGRISARLRFRAAARDTASVVYATGSDPGTQSWGSRGSSAYDQHTTMVSTVGVNVQSDSDLKVELFGEVQINFASETLPLDRFIDSARMTLLQRNAKWDPAAGASPQSARPAGTAPGQLTAAPAAPGTAVAPPSPATAVVAPAPTVPVLVPSPATGGTP